ncbi:MAG TPA: EAL domain-containing protein [Pyrinomonadaceae bacterium]|jgi:diguanylate cyclase (GGDEF)-like protein/PAS domain S-box-containing protein|nr:EAL domain-containing protein [Pyrinomonadaceae bacterium]
MKSLSEYEAVSTYTKVIMSVYAIIFLAAVYCLPVAHIGLPLLLFALLAVRASSSFPVKIAGAGNHLYLTDSFLLLSMLVFDAEAATVLACIVTPCVLLHSSKSIGALIFRSALSILPTFIAALLLRFGFGSVPQLLQAQDLPAIATALVVVIAAQSVISASLLLLGRSASPQQKRWQAFVKSYLRPLSVYLAAGGVAGLLAAATHFAGLNVVTLAGVAVAIAYFAYTSYRDNHFISAPPQAQVALANTNNAQSDEDRFRNAFDFAAIGMALVSSEGRWLQVNRALCKILGYTEREMIVTDFLTVIHPDDLSVAVEAIKRLRKGNSTIDQCEVRFQHKSGHKVWGLWSASLAGGSHGSSTPLVFQIQDITDRKRAEEQLQHEAMHDVLTGLPNRAMFIDHLELAIARAQRNEARKFAVLYVDLDRFKIINDSLGHAVGDQLLKEIAVRLWRCVRAGDTVARLGGDEFVLLLEDIYEENEAIEVAERIKSELAASFTLNGREVFTTVSIGVASSWTSYHQAEGLIRDADAAMYRAKSLGKNRHEIYDSAMHAQVNDLLQMETALRMAVERNELVVYYQSIVDLATFKISGFEALVRWNHPERGFISPANFIPLAEETGLIVDIGEWVLRDACRQMERWQKIFPSDPPLFVSVNLSSKQFIQSDLIQRVTQIIQETKINPEGLKLEITESAVMDNVETATEMLKKLRALGIKLSIDDFGTGYSSLSYLHRFPIDTLKVDRSFVVNMSEDSENVEIVRTIVSLAQNLGMNVIAEGVETKEQLAALRKLGCENGQGYFFSKPVNAKAAENLICDTYTVEPTVENLVNSARTPEKVVRYSQVA